MIKIFIATIFALVVAALLLALVASPFLLAKLVAESAPLDQPIHQAAIIGAEHVEAQTWPLVLAVIGMCLPVLLTIWAKGMIENASRESANDPDLPSWRRWIYQRLNPPAPRNQIDLKLHAPPPQS